jgi:hypothetical protein
MNYDLETELRNALRRKQPSRDLMPVVPRPERSWWKFAIAAMLALGIGGSAYRTHEQRQAKDQLVFALRLTAVKLQHTKAQIQTIRLERHR